MKIPLFILTATIVLFAGSVNADALFVSSAGETDANGCYLDMGGGEWEHESEPYKICTYDTTYAILTAIGDVCGSGAEQYYYNFGSAFTSADFTGTETWTVNFYPSPAPDVIESMCDGGGGGTSSATTTELSTDKQVDVLMYGIIVFMLSFMFPLWMFRRPRV